MLAILCGKTHDAFNSHAKENIKISVRFCEVNESLRKECVI